ncbi:MAG: lysylphosphatidylglycerol synthase transmembrane domain-containing protein [Halanaerobium sp.]|nr:lysylphosphatidylglycerol synthase transmembrane domain-containing protein [Halanaerobium sp.]
MEKRDLSSSNIKKGIKISIGLSLLASLAVIFFTIEEETWHTLLRVKPFVLSINLIATLLMWLAGGLRTRVLARALGEELSLLETTEIFLAGAFMANVTPSSTGSGPLLLYLLYRKGIPLGKASTIMFIQAICRLFFFSFLVPILYIFFPGYIESGIIPIQLFNLVIGISLLISLASLYFIWKPRILYRFVKGLQKAPFIKKYLQSEKAQSIMAMVLEETENFHLAVEKITQKKKGVLIYSLLITVFYWIFFFSIPSLTLMGFGEEPHFFRSSIMQTMLNLVLPFVPTPGSSGVAEFGFVAIFAPFINKHLIGLITIAWRFFTFYLPTFVGGLIIVKIYAISIFNNRKNNGTKES